jgi:hypothetical protein
MDVSYKPTWMYLRRFRHAHPAAEALAPKPTADPKPVTDAFCSQ